MILWNFFQLTTSLITKSHYTWNYNPEFIFFYLYKKLTTHLNLYFFIYQILYMKKPKKIFKKLKKFLLYTTPLQRLSLFYPPYLKKFSHKKFYFNNTRLANLHPYFLTKTSLLLHSTFSIKGLTSPSFWWNFKNWNYIKHLKRFIKIFNYPLSWNPISFKYFYKNFYYIKPHFVLSSKRFFEKTLLIDYQSIFNSFWITKHDFTFLNTPGWRNILKNYREWQWDTLHMWKLVKLRKKFLKKLKKSKNQIFIYSSILKKSRFLTFSSVSIFSNQTFSFFTSTFFTNFRYNIIRNPKKKNKFLKKLKIQLLLINHFLLLRKTTPFYFFLPHGFFKKKKTYHFTPFNPVVKTSSPLRSFLTIRTPSAFNTLANVHQTLSYRSSVRTRFLSPSWGFFYLSSWKSPTNYLQKLYFKLKITMFSFFEKNDYYIFIIKTSLKSSLISPFWSTIFRNKKNIYFKHFRPLNSLFRTEPQHNSLLQSNFLLVNFSNNKSLDFFQRFGENLERHNREKLNMKIKRIKFKPGYMIYWRNSRTALKNVFQWKFHYQYNLTRYLSKFYKFVRYNLIKFFEMQLANIIYLSRILIVKPFVTDFINSNCVFVNGWLANNSTFQIFKNDFIQFVIHLKFYFFYKYMLNFLIKEKFYIRKVVKYKFKILSPNKQLYSTLPAKLRNKLNFEYDTPKFMEVDFFSYSIFILFEPMLIGDLTIDKHFSNRSGVFNLYNWKYIT